MSVFLLSFNVKMIIIILILKIIIIIVIINTFNYEKRFNYFFRSWMIQKINNLHIYISNSKKGLKVFFGGGGGVLRVTWCSFRSRCCLWTPADWTQSSTGSAQWCKHRSAGCRTPPPPSRLQQREAEEGFINRRGNSVKQFHPTQQLWSRSQWEVTVSRCYNFIFLSTDPNYPTIQQH